MRPILPSNRRRYPADWPEIRQRILQRARHRCEECDVHDRAWGWRDGEGGFHQVRRRELVDAGFRRPPFDIATRSGTLHVIEIILTVAHLDHVPEHCTDDNLRALCQQCHNRHDRRHRDHTRRFGTEQGQLELLPAVAVAPWRDLPQPACHSTSTATISRPPRHQPTASRLPTEG